MKTVLPLSIIILLIAAGTAYFVFSPTKSKTPVSTIPSPTQQVAPQTDSTTETSPAANNPTLKKTGIDAIKAYAALQFSVSEDKVIIVSSEKQDWDDICLGITIPDYKCTKTKTSGYEAVVEAGGYTATYRGSEDGTIIRVVKK